MTHQVIKKLLCCVLVTSHVSAFAVESGGHLPPPPPPEAEGPKPEAASEDQKPEDRLFEVEVVTSEANENDQPASQPTPAHQVDQYQVIVPTLHASQDKSNAGGMRFNFANRTVGSIRGVLEECLNRGFSPDFWKKEPPEIWIYFPSKEYFEENSRVVAEQVLANYQAVYEGSKPTIRMLIANTPVNVEFLANELKSSVDELIKYAPGQAESLNELKDVIDQTKYDAIRLETAQQKAEKVAWYRRPIKGGPHVSAVNSDRIKFWGAFVRAGALGAIRTYQFMPAFMMGPKQSAVALGAIAFDMGVEIFTALLSQRIQTFFMRWPNLSYIQRQPWAPNWIKHPTVDSIVGLLTSGIWNTSLFVVVRASVMQASQAAAMPGLGLTYPTAQSTLDSVKINSIGILTNWFWVKGYSLLKDKGWLTGAAVNVGLLGLSTTDLAIGIANSSSDESIRGIRNYMLPLQWGIYIGIFVAGIFAPKNAKRIIMVHNHVVDEAKADAKKKAEAEAAKKNVPVADNDNFGVSDIPWLTLEQSGLRSLWTIPDQEHDVEIGRVVSLLDKRRQDAEKKAKESKVKPPIAKRWWPFRGNAALKADEICQDPLEQVPTAEQISEADGEENAS